MIVEYVERTAIAFVKVVFCSSHIRASVQVEQVCRQFDVRQSADYFTVFHQIAELAGHTDRAVGCDVAARRDCHINEAVGNVGHFVCRVDDVQTFRSVRGDGVERIACRACGERQVEKACTAFIGEQTAEYTAVYKFISVVDCAFGIEKRSVRLLVRALSVHDKTESIRKKILAYFV